MKNVDTITTALSISALGLVVFLMYVFINMPLVVG